MMQESLPPCSGPCTTWAGDIVSIFALLVKFTARYSTLVHLYQKSTISLFLLSAFIFQFTTIFVRHILTWTCLVPSSSPSLTYLDLSLCLYILSCFYLLDTSGAIALPLTLSFSSIQLTIQNHHGTNDLPPAGGSMHIFNHHPLSNSIFNNRRRSASNKASTES